MHWFSLNFYLLTLPFMFQNVEHLPSVRKFPSNGTGIFFGTKKRNRIELCHLQNTGKSFAFSWHQAWHGRFGKNGKTVIPQKVLQENFHRDEPFNLNSPRNFRVFHTNGKRSLFKMNHVFTVKWTVIGSFQSFFFASRRENFSMRWLCKRYNYGNEDKLSESNSDSRSSIFPKMVHVHR